MSRKRQSEPEPEEEFDDDSVEDSSSPPLTALEKSKIHRLAKAAATTARYELACELVTFDRLEKNVRSANLQLKAKKISVWLMRNQALLKFYKVWFEGKDRFRNGHVRIFRPGGAIIGGLIDPKTIKSYNELVQEMALRFITSTSTDEIRELRHMEWGITVPTTAQFQPGKDGQRTYTHKPSRLTATQLLGGQEAVDVIKYIQIRNQEEPDDTHKAPPPDARHKALPPDARTIEDMVRAAEAAGHKKELDTCYKQTLRETEQGATEELLSSVDRAEKFAKRERRKEVAKSVSKGAVKAGRFVAMLKGLGGK